MKPPISMNLPTTEKGFRRRRSEYDFEVVICENGSTDDTYEKLRDPRHDERFKIVQLSRNFQMEGGMMAACPTSLVTRASL